jgi:hypothetical protein
MNASLLAVLNDAERLLVAQTEPAELAALDEDAAIELEGRIRRARNKYVGQYRRAASARVAEQGGRGMARPQNSRAAMKAEAFEEALSRVSRRVAVLARQSAAALRAERLAAARAVKQGQGPAQEAAASPDGKLRHNGARRPCPPLASNRDAPGEHPRRGRPAAGKAGQPVSAPAQPPGRGRTSGQGPADFRPENQDLIVPLLS